METLQQGMEHIKNLADEFPHIDPLDLESQAAVNHEHYNHVCAEAWRMFEQWGVDPTWWMSFNPYVFTLAAEVPASKWKSFCLSMYARDKAYSDDQKTPVVFRGWITIDESEHPCATRELVNKMQ